MILLYYCDKNYIKCEYLIIFIFLIIKDIHKDIQNENISALENSEPISEELPVSIAL